jgi:hypothetical protein
MLWSQSSDPWPWVLQQVPAMKAMPVKSSPAPVQESAPPAPEEEEEEEEDTGSATGNIAAAAHAKSVGRGINAHPSPPQGVDYTRNMRS